MVRETTTLGQGQAPNTRPQEMPTVRNVAVYESTRNVENWELAFAAEKACESIYMFQLTHKFHNLFGRDVYMSLDNKHTKRGPSEVFFQAFLLWKKREPLGLGKVGDLAKMLRECRMDEIAEKLEP